MNQWNKMNKMVEELKMEIEEIKNDGTVEMKYIGQWKGTVDKCRHLQQNAQMEERMSWTESIINKIDMVVNENAKSERNS